MAAIPTPNCSGGRPAKRPLLDLIQSSDAQLIKQGAEAKVYKTRAWAAVRSGATADAPEYTPPPLLLKHRFPKGYRHPILDAQLTKQRLAHEARCLSKAFRSGVKVPGIRCVDGDGGVLGVEWIEGWTVREVLGGGAEGEVDLGEEAEAEAEADSEPSEPEGGLRDRLERVGLNTRELLKQVGEEIGKLHKADIVHGDLTTSNMMVRVAPSDSAHASLSGGDLLALTGDSQPPVEWEVVLIDFGLAHVSTLVEDKAVDLYVLERAFSSTHPDEGLSAAEPAPACGPSPAPNPGHGGPTRGYRLVEAAYASTLGPREWDKVRRRLEDVRLRGRKRSMVG